MKPTEQRTNPSTRQDVVRPRSAGGGARPTTATTRPARPVAELRARNEDRCRRLLAMAAPLEVEDLEWTAVADTPVAPWVIDCLVYMRDVEGFTDRDLVGLTAHRSTLADPLIGPFLEIWRSEEAGHTRALDRFLRATGAAVPERQQPPPSVAPRVERVVARLGGPVGAVVTAAHMAWGAANELLTLNGYRILAARCDHPVLAELLRRIAVQEARHYSFYLLQAEWRLAASRAARFVLPRVLDRSWTPVGVGEGYKSRDDFDRLLTCLVDGEQGLRVLARMDARVASLPGFEDLRIFQAAAA